MHNRHKPFSPHNLTPYESVISDGLLLAIARSAVVSAILLFVAMLLLIGAGVYVVGRFRGGADEDRPDDEDWLLNLRESHARGELSDAEFRTIKTRWAERSRDELSDTSDKG